MLQGIIPPFPTGTYEFPPPQANLDTPLPSDLFALSRKDAGSAKQQKTNRDAPWHNLIPWPRDKAGTLIFGLLATLLASNHQKMPERDAAQGVEPDSRCRCSNVVTHRTLFARDAVPTPRLAG